MSTARVTGRVKWFNNKAGYGFITLVDGDNRETDVFVHHSSISLKDQYRYLVQGEYVEFSLIPTNEGSSHKYQAGDVKGINGGMLMCETRRINRLNKPKTVDDDVIETSSSPVRTVSVRGSGPREGDSSVSKDVDKSTQPSKKRGRPSRSTQSKEKV
jgi:CspA family cold shock protein